MPYGRHTGSLEDLAIVVADLAIEALPTPEEASLDRDGAMAVDVVEEEEDFSQTDGADLTIMPVRMQLLRMLIFEMSFATSFEMSSKTSSRKFVIFLLIVPSSDHKFGIFFYFLNFVFTI